MEAITFNDTSNYQHLEIFGVPGVFTPALINKDTLPKGFHAYTIWGQEPGCFDAVCKDPCDESHRTGDFITKKELHLKDGIQSTIEAEDLEYTGQEFSMEDYFGVKESIDLQIENADKKRRAQSQEQIKQRTPQQKQQKLVGQVTICPLFETMWK